MELILVRHGQPAWTSPEGFNRNDPELTELGHRQAAMVAERLADTEDFPARGEVDHLLVSPALRAVQTAAPIATALDMDPELLAWLWELRMPDSWDGSPVEAVQEAFAWLQTRSRQEWWDGQPGGESLRDFHQRVTGGLRATLERFGARETDDPGLWDIDDDAPRRLVAVAHGGTNGTIVADLLGVTPEPWEWDRFAMGHASVAVLVTRPVAGHHIWSLRALGDANHLPLDDRTV